NQSVDAGAAIDSSEQTITGYGEKSERRTRQIRTAASRIESVERHVANRKARIDWADSKHQSETERIEQTTQRIDDTKQSVISSERAIEQSDQQINEYNQFLNEQRKVIEQQKAEIEAKRQEQVQAQQRAEHKEKAEIEQKILGRTAF